MSEGSENSYYVSDVINSAQFDGTEVYVRPAWHRQAACRDAPPGLFFSERGENAKVREAKQICAGCGVREQCLEQAMAWNEKHGTWGGLSERQRRTRRERRSAA